MLENPFRRKTQRLRHAVLEGPATLPPGTRRAAAENSGLTAGVAAYVAQVHSDALRVTDTQVAELAGELDQDAVFELTVAAATGAGLSRLERVLKLLDEEAP